MIDIFLPIPLLALWNVGRFKISGEDKFRQLSQKESRVSMMTKTDKFLYSELDGKYMVVDVKVKCRNSSLIYLDGIVVRLDYSTCEDCTPQFGLCIFLPHLEIMESQEKFSR